MKYINEKHIFELIEDAKNTTQEEIDRILDKSRSLKRLTLAESAALLSIEAPKQIDELLKTAAYVKNTIYGKRIVLFAPLYISNFCSNNCAYCSFKSDNKSINRKALSNEEIKRQVEWLLKRGHKRLLLVAGEAPPKGISLIDYYTDAIESVYSVTVGQNYIRRVNVNFAPLSLDEFKILKKSKIGTYQLFQETYHSETYAKVHPRGPKSDPDNRIDAIDRAFEAGIDDVGIGVLYGLYDYKYETLGLLSHVEHLENRFNVGPHTISIPRLEPADGTDFTETTPYKISDYDFKKITAVLRLSVPYTGLILSTRETAEMRNELFALGISQVSAESSTTPGGYQDSDSNNEIDGQFHLSDHRSLDEIVGSLVEKELIPSFCTGCYRSNRTGENFMNLAKPGIIKGKCQLNALITLKEYLDDFASEKVKKSGYELLDKIKTRLDEKDQKVLFEKYSNIDKGVRDEFV